MVVYQAFVQERYWLCLELEFYFRKKRKQIL